MKVVWTATAIQRLEEIDDYISMDDPVAAERFVAAIMEEAESLALAPGRGRNLVELPKSGLRETIFRGYRLVYRVQARRIQILTVFEGHRLLRETELDR